MNKILAVRCGIEDCGWYDPYLAPLDLTPRSVSEAYQLFWNH